MPEQSIKIVVENSIGFAWLVIIAIWGGTASYLGRLKKKKGKFSMVELIGEWTISGFAGIITAYFCQEFSLSFFMTAALAGISGHMGGRAIFLIEQIFEKKAKSLIDSNDSSGG